MPLTECPVAQKVFEGINFCLSVNQWFYLKYKEILSASSLASVQNKQEINVIRTCKSTKTYFLTAFVINWLCNWLAITSKGMDLITALLFPYIWQLMELRNFKLTHYATGIIVIRYYKFKCSTHATLNKKNGISWLFSKTDAINNYRLILFSTCFGPFQW